MLESIPPAGNRVQKENWEIYFFDVIQSSEKASAPATTQPIKHFGIRDRSGVPIGIVSYTIHNNELFISKFASHQCRADIGSILVEEIQREARKNLVDTIRLEARTHEATEKLYEHCGFKKKAFYRIDPEDPASDVIGIWFLEVLKENGTPTPPHTIH